MYVFLLAVVSMIQKVIAATTVFALLAVPSMASAHHSYHYHYAGPRLGLGVSYLSNNGIDTDTGFKFEVGNDFNRIVGMKLSYEQSGYDYYYDSVDYSTFKLGVDLGYAFEISHDFAMKPYVSFGFHRTTEDDYWCSDRYCYSSSYSDTNTYTGFGLRLTARTLYFDISNEKLDIDVGRSHIQPKQVAFTIGLKI